MTDRFPLILDPSDIKLKELPLGDNLDLQGSGLVNANSITTDSLTVNNISIDNQSLSAVAFSNDFNDLDNTPTGFSGDYQDLINKPSIPGILKDLNDVSGDQPTDGQALLYNDLQGEYIPSDILTDVDLEDFNIGDLGNVIITGNVTDRFLKFTAGAWRPAKVQYSEVQDKPTNVSFFANDAGYITTEDLQQIQGDFVGSVFADDSTLLVDGVNGTVPGTLTGNWNDPDNGFDVIGLGLTVNTTSTNFSVVDGGVTITNSNNGENISLVIGSGDINLACSGNIALAVDSISMSTSSDFNLSVSGDYNLASSNFTVGNGNVIANTFQGDLNGSVFADDSTPLIDGVNGTLPYVPSTASDWQSPAPESVYEALDRLAAAVASLGTNA